MGWLTLAVAFRKTTDPDVRLEVAGAAREAEDLADAEQRLDRSTTGRIYISDAFDRYKVYYTAIERDARGRVTTRQRTRTFRRDAPHVTPEGGQLTAFEAAVEFKRERDLDAALEREHRTATLDETFEGYLVRRGVRPKTARDYRQQWYKYVTPTIGGYDLSNVTVTVVERWYEDLADVAQASRTKVANLLRGVLRDAYDRGEIAQNPGRVLRPPASRVRALRPDEIPTQEQVRRLAGRGRRTVLAAGAAPVSRDAPGRGRRLAVGPRRPRVPPDHRRRDDVRGRRLRSAEDRCRCSDHRPAEVHGRRAARA